MRGAFTLLETLVVFTVLAVLVAVAIPASTRVSQYSARMRAVSNMRQLGVAAHLYANDHNQQLPGHPTSGGIPLLGNDAGGDWPQLFCEYLSPSDPRVFLDPADRLTKQLPLSSVLSETINNTGYIYNGFDDLAPPGEGLGAVPLSRLETPSQIILLAPKTQGAKEFYADVLLQPLTDLLSHFNPVVYDGGAHYLFVDGSVRFFKGSEYSHTFWLSDKTVALPSLPLLPLTNDLSGLASGSAPDPGGSPLM